jgi:hypothetical protein
MYEYLYCMLNGFPGKSLNPETAEYVLKSLNDLAVEVRERGIQRERVFLDCVRRISSQVRQYAGKKRMEVRVANRMSTVTCFCFTVFNN